MTKINFYFAALIITVMGSLAALTIIRVAWNNQAVYMYGNGNPAFGTY